MILRDAAHVDLIYAYGENSKVKSRVMSNVQISPWRICRAHSFRAMLQRRRVYALAYKDEVGHQLCMMDVSTPALLLMSVLYRTCTRLE